MLITELQADLDSFDDSANRATKFLEMTRRYKDFSELTAPMLYEFIDRIEIHGRAECKVKLTTDTIVCFDNLFL